MTLRIRTRLLIMLLIGLGIVLGAGGAAVYWIAKSNLTSQFDEGLKSRAHTLATLVKLEPGQLVFESGDAPAATVAETYFELRVRGGNSLKRSPNLGETPLPARDLDEHEFAVADIELPGAGQGRALWLAFRPRMDADDWGNRDISKVEHEVLIMAAAMDRGPLDRALATLLGALVGVGAVIALTVAALVIVGVRWGLLPLDQLTRHLTQVDAASLSRRFAETGVPRELLPIHMELNRMLDRVEQTVKRERAFADAAAHELRTPLAELRTTTEVALRWPDMQRAQAALGEALAIGREMERLVESLLRISRTHSACIQQPVEPVHVAPVVRQCIQHADESVKDRNLQVSIGLKDDDTIQAPREALEIIVRNLIDNAVQYTPLHGTISISTGRNGNSTLVVENGPVNLSQEDLPRLFEPFWRMDGARTDRRHVGLGLTIVQRVAQASGLRIDTELVDDRLRMVVSAKH